MAAAAEYRTEHIAETPRGWRVRMKAPDPQSQHLVAVAFPPGRRKKGSGRLVEILHPAEERNPRCEVSEKAKKNPGELLIFGNPGEVRVLVQLYRLGKERVAIKARKVKGGDWVAEANVRGEKIQSPKQSSSANAFYYVENEIHRKFGPFVGSNPSTLAEKRATRERAARIRGARLNPELFDTIGPRDRVTFLNRFNQRQTGRVVMRSSHGGWVLNMGGPHGTPAVIDSRTPIVKVKKANPKAKLTSAEDRAWAKAFQFYVDAGKSDAQADRLAWRDVVKEFPRLKKFSGAKANPKAFAGWKHFTLKEKNFLRSIHAPAPKNEEEVRAYREVLRKIDEINAQYRKSNPRHLSVPERHQLKIAIATLRMPDAMVGVMGGPNKEEAREIIRHLTGKQPKENRHTARRRRTDRRNPDQSQEAVRLFEKFHGRDPKEITEKHVSAAMRKDYTALGDLEHLKVITPLGQTVQFQFEGDGVKLASSPDGKQLYCIGGNQNLSSCLDKDSLEKDFIDLGECVQVQYLARKVHANFEPVSYYHKFGEKTGARPQLAYDKLKRSIFFVGGEYFIDTKQGVSPGIEN